MHAASRQHMVAAGGTVLVSGLAVFCECDKKFFQELSLPQLLRHKSSELINTGVTD